MNLKLHNPAVRLTADANGLKSLHSADGRCRLTWQTLLEYDLTVQTAGETAVLDSNLAVLAGDTVTASEWVRVYEHPLMTVKVVYALENMAAMKTVAVTAKQPVTLRYARTETATSQAPLTRGGEGQPLFVGDDGFVAILFPTAENGAESGVLSLRQAPFVSLQKGESFALEPVVFGLNHTGDMALSFRQFLLPRRPHPNDSMRIYCDWAAHDELALDDPPELDEAMARRLLGSLVEAREKTGLTFDYYLMDAYWYALDTYTDFKKPHWPEGPESFIREIEAAGMKFGLWFDVNLQKVNEAGKTVLRSQTKDELCMADEGNIDWLFDCVEKHVRDNRVRLLKFDFAYFECDNPEHGFHSQRHTASKEPAVRNFIRKLAELQKRYPDLRVLAYNGFTTSLSYIGSVDKNRKGYAISPFWATAIDYLYCGDPRPAEWPAPLEKSLLHYTDCMVEQFTDSLLPREAIDDHGTMLGTTSTIYYLGKRALRDSYLLNIVRGTRKCHLYGETVELDDADWQFMADAQPLFDFVCHPDCHTDPVLDKPSNGSVYGYSTTDGDRGVITVVNCKPVAQTAAVSLPCWRSGDRLKWRRRYHAGAWCDEELPIGGSLNAEIEPFGVDMYEWERVSCPQPLGYADLDIGTTMRLPLPKGCTRVGLRYLSDTLSPLRAQNVGRDGLMITAEGGSLTQRDAMPIWSAVSFTVYDVSPTGAQTTLVLANTSNVPITLQWQDMTGKENLL